MCMTVIINFAEFGTQLQLSFTISETESIYGGTTYTNTYVQGTTVPCAHDTVLHAVCVIAECTLNFYYTSTSRASLIYRDEVWCLHVSSIIIIFKNTRKHNIFKERTTYIL